MRLFKIVPAQMQTEIERYSNIKRVILLKHRKVGYAYQRTKKKKTTYRDRQLKNQSQNWNLI